MGWGRVTSRAVWPTRNEVTAAGADFRRAPPFQGGAGRESDQGGTEGGTEGEIN